MHLLRARRGVFVGKFWRRPRSPAQATLIGYAGWLCRGLVSATSYTLIGVANKLGTVLLAICFLDKHASARRAENRQKGRGISTRHPRRRRDPAHPNVVEMSTGTHLERRKNFISRAARARASPRSSRASAARRCTPNRRCGRTSPRRTRRPRPRPASRREFSSVFFWRGVFLILRFRTSDSIHVAAAASPRPICRRSTRVTVRWVRTRQASYGSPSSSASGGRSTRYATRPTKGTTLTARRTPWSSGATPRRVRSSGTSQD